MSRSVWNQLWYNSFDFRFFFDDDWLWIRRTMFKASLVGASLIDTASLQYVQRLKQCDSFRQKCHNRRRLLVFGRVFLWMDIWWLFVGGNTFTNWGLSDETGRLEYNFDIILGTLKGTQLSVPYIAYLFLIIGAKFWFRRVRSNFLNFIWW